MRQLFFTFLTLVVITLLNTQCAKISQPTGGPKDTLPPVLEIAVPIDGSLNYRGRIVTLQFDEFIKTENFREELIITPTYSGSYDVKSNKNTVTLELEDALEDSTTYTFNFREGIVDLNESNAPTNLKISFSTGDYIDSLAISGEVRDLFRNEVREDYLVSLFLITDTLDVFNQKPTYLTKTDEEGRFEITNIKDGKYRLLSYFDENKNLILESQREPFGFISDTINLLSNIENLLIPIQELDMRPISLNNARPVMTYFDLKYNKSLVSYDIQFLNDSAELTSHLIENNQTIRFYPEDHDFDSLLTVVTSIDSVNQQSSDTVYLKFDREREKEEFSYTLSVSDLDKVMDSIDFTIEFNKPIAEVTPDSFMIMFDTVTTFQIRAESMTWNEYRDRVRIKQYVDSALFFDKLRKQVKDSVSESVPANPLFIVYISKGSFKSIEEDHNNLIVRKLGFFKQEDLGILSGPIVTEYPSFKIQLLDPAFNVVAEQWNGTDYLFKNLRPGRYTFRVLIDKNENGTWEYGNFFENRSPEPILFPDKNLPIRANWEINEEVLTF